MNARLIKNNERQIWDDFVSTHHKGHVFQSFDWGEFRRKAGWEPLRLIVEEENKIKAAVSLLLRKIPFLGSVCYASRGPILDYKDKQTFDYLLEQVKNICVSRKAIFLLLDPDIPETDVEFIQYLKTKKFIQPENYGVVGLTQPKRVFRLDLLRTEDEIWAEFRQSHRRKVRLAEKNGVTIEEATDLQSLEKFYELFQETGARKHFYIRSLNYQKLLYEYFHQDGQIAIFLARHNGKIISGRLILIYGDKAWDMYAGSDNEQQGFNTSCYLVWHVIKYAKARGCRWFDFRGADSPDPNSPLYGVHMFKKGFGPEFIEFIGDYYLVFSEFHFALLGKLRNGLNYGIRIYKMILRKKIFSILRGFFSRDNKAKLLTDSVLEKYGQKEEVDAHSELVQKGLLVPEEKLIDKYYKNLGKILNVGCGAGREAIALLKKGYQVTGIDLQPMMVEKARENTEKEGLKAEFFEMDATKLDFPDETFEYALMVGSIISHVPRRTNRVQAVKEVKRTLKQGGCVIISTPNRDSHIKYGIYFAVMNPLRRLLRCCLGHEELEDWDRFGVKVSCGESRGKVYSHMYSMDEMIQDIETAGLKVVECRSRYELEHGLDKPQDRKKDYFLYFVARKEEKAA